MPNGTASISSKEAEAPPQGSGSTITVSGGIPNYVFAEKLVPVLIDLLLHAPAVEKYIIFPEIIQSLERYYSLYSLMLHIFLRQSTLLMILCLEV